MMREKYIEERFPRWFIFGQTEDQQVCVSHANGDVVVTSCEVAAELIAERDRVIDMLWKLADALDKAAPETFEEIWYGGR